jgi:ribose transport system permease protein
MAMTLEQTIDKQESTWIQRLLRSQTFWVIIALLVAMIYLSFKSQAFLTPQNLYNITRNFTFVAIIALGMTFVIITGGIDLSVGSVLCLCSMVIAITMKAGWSLEFGVTFALLAGLAVGAFNGYLVAFLRFPPFVVTLGMMSIARSIAMIISANQTLFQFGPDHQRLLQLGGGATFGIANPVIYTVALAVITAFVLKYTRFGRYVFAIGGNEHAAMLSGIPVRGVKVAVYAISALAAGIAGIVQTGWLGAVTTNIGNGMELLVIAAAVIGGASLVGGSGTALGALVGAALLEVIRNSLGLLGINPFWQGAFIGTAILGAVAFERVQKLGSRE